MTDVNNQNSKPSVFTMAGVLGLTLVFFSLAYVFFDIATRGEAPIQGIWMFYRKGQIQTSTLIWYILSLLILLGGIRLRLMKLVRWRKSISTGLVAFFLSPSVFANPAQLDNWLSLLAIPFFRPDEVIIVVILPAWVCIIRYVFQCPYLWYCLATISTTIWPILAFWFVLLVIKRFWFHRSSDS